MASPDIFLGEVRLFGGQMVPRGWRLCDGSSLSVATHGRLFGQIGQSFGGSGDTFQVPSLADPARNLRYIICTEGLSASHEGSFGAATIGEIRYFAGFIGSSLDSIPANGRLVNSHQYPALRILLGDRFGGDNLDQLQIPGVPALVSGNQQTIQARLFHQGVFPSGTSGSDSYTGEVRLMALQSDDAPQGWMPCDGSSLPTGQYPTLFSVIRDRFGLGKLPQLPDFFGVSYYLQLDDIYPY